MFTIELRSKDDVKNVTVDGDTKVIVEGTLGTLKRAHFVEDLVLEVTGTNGVLRLDLAASDLCPPTRAIRTSKEEGDGK
ncbi:MAG: hypothetical protein MZV70_43790 [Desulfobacterales bacterium]|nr:hypothetical protein [Desulfobacterales bacterium]